MDESLFVADLTSWQQKCRRELNPLYLKSYKNCFWHHYRGLTFGVWVYTGVFYWYLNLGQEHGRSCNLHSAEMKPFPQGCSPITRSSEARAWGSFLFSQHFSKTFCSTAYKRSTWKSHADRGEVLVNARDLHLVPVSDWISLFDVLPAEGESSLLLAACSILVLLLKHLFKTDHGPPYLWTIRAMRLCMGGEQRQRHLQRQRQRIPDAGAGIFLPTPCTWRRSWEEHSLLSRTIC